ncbi:MAG: hypothetical protein ACXVB1_08945 [Pseudobdellovibrionaceae bacterium]
MEQKEKTQAELQHESNKVVRHSLAWLHWKLGTQTFFLEEAQEALQARGVLEAFCLDLQKKIEEVEPPVKQEEPQEPKKPYIIDATPKAE